MYNMYTIILIILYNIAHTTSCQLVYPSEYAYHDDSVTRAESSTANCRNYPSQHVDGAFVGNYIHCDGTQRKLTDSGLGQGQYSSSDYYVWSARSDGQLLFIFPTRVSLTTITLHYYSDSDQGLPRLRFYAVLDNFDVWDAPTIGTPHVDVASVPPGGEPAGRRNVSINVNFNKKKVLMYKFSSSFVLSFSEVEFFACKLLSVSLLLKVSNASSSGAIITTSTLTMAYIPTTNTFDTRTTFIESATTEKGK